MGFHGAFREKRINQVFNKLRQDGDKRFEMTSGAKT
jgi:hypothetical protein